MTGESHEGLDTGLHTGLVSPTRDCISTVIVSDHGALILLLEVIVGLLSLEEANKPILLFVLVALLPLDVIYGYLSVDLTWWPSVSAVACFPFLLFVSLLSVLITQHFFLT